MCGRINVVGMGFDKNKEGLKGGVVIDSGLNDQLSELFYGHLVVDAAVPPDKLLPVAEALINAGILYTVSLVDGYFSPELRTRTQRIVGVEAIIAYANSNLMN